MFSIELEREIKGSQSGSDIHGLVQKIAYRLHEKRSRKSADDNWFMAEDLLLRWSNFQYGNDHLNKKKDTEFSLSNQLHIILNHYAHDHHKYSLSFGNKTSPYFDWVDAQDELARQVLHQVTII
jgi:hypothetical protein